MKFDKFTFLVSLLLCWLTINLNAGMNVQNYLDKYCTECHDEEVQKGKIRLDNFALLSANLQSDFLSKIEEQVYLEQMPPKKKNKLLPADRTAFLNTLTSQFKSMQVKSAFQDKLRYPDYGNYVDHKKLFSGEIKEKPFTYERRWLVSPEIFHGRVIDVFGIDKSQRERLRGGSFNGVSNPFILPDNSGVRYYDNGMLNGGHLQILLSNAEAISKKQMQDAMIYKPRPSRPNQPKDILEDFSALVKKETPLTSDELNLAITTQFKLVLQREPNTAELEKYKKLTEYSIQALGKNEGFRKMLVAVLMESEFLYRQEFGNGQTDQYGRRMLNPRELSYAISYALSDFSPDPILEKAAAEGKLNSKEDVKREVERLLNDKVLLAGIIDPVLNKRNFIPHISTHPKIIRFFREFFGYPNCSKIFKDEKRSNLQYVNPVGDPGTPGDLVNEADMIVDYHFQNDKNVFENILSSDLYYAAPMKDAQKKIDGLNAMYDHFKDMDWQKNSKLLVEQNKDFINKTFREAGGEKQLVQIMNHVKQFRDKGLQPHPIWGINMNPIYGGLLTRWVVFYNIDPFNQNYVVQQPYSIPNRKGILLHPAWLMSTSHNFHTDPVKRGRWIREKLLADRVPDVPITVNAVIPEDHDKTLRERFDSAVNQEECWKCHKQMNPLGNAFEAYDDFGRYRLDEPLENESNIITRSKSKYDWDTYKTKKVTTTGALEGTGDSSLDGEVNGAIDLIERLAKSERVRQSIIRHAFRFFMGRNEMISDSQTLIDADKAYVQSGGSFKAVVLSLLTSDSFIYRKKLEE